MRKIYSFGLVLVFLWSMNGCAYVEPSHLRSVSVAAAVGANHNTATAIDLVFVYNPPVTAALPFTGPAWFDQKAALEANYATSMDVVSLQIPPDTTVNVTLPKRSSAAIAVVAFSNYISPGGQPAAKLSHYRDLLIQLEPETIVYRGR